jgi:hypothetical protein
MTQFPEWDMSTMSDGELEALILRARHEERRARDRARKATWAKLRQDATREHSRRAGLTPLMPPRHFANPS